MEDEHNWQTVKPTVWQTCLGRFWLYCSAVLYCSIQVTGVFVRVSELCARTKSQSCKLTANLAVVCGSSSWLGFANPLQLSLQRQHWNEQGQGRKEKDLEAGVRSALLKGNRVALHSSKADKVSKGASTGETTEPGMIGVDVEALKNEFGLLDRTMESHRTSLASRDQKIEISEGEMSMKEGPILTVQGQDSVLSTKNLISDHIVLARMSSNWRIPPDEVGQRCTLLPKLWFLSVPILSVCLQPSFERSRLAPSRAFMPSKRLCVLLSDIHEIPFLNWFQATNAIEVIYVYF